MGRARFERAGNAPTCFDYEEPTPEATANVRVEDGVVVIRDWDNNEFRALIAT